MLNRWKNLFLCIHFSCFVTAANEYYVSSIIMLIVVEIIHVNTIVLDEEDIIQKNQKVSTH